MPSQAKIPPTEPHIPTTPFEAIACDFFQFIGHHYFVAADRLSGWIELQQVKVGTNEAGAEGLCKALRRLMVTFGVPVEVSSDGGPEFTAGETKDFFRRWGIRHRLSSAYLPSSNGRAELAVKSAKRLLMDNISASGQLDNDSVVQALLTYRNTPEPGCKLSPAQILLGRPLRDTLPTVSKDIMIFNNPDVHSQWREAWSAKEEALKIRYMKTIETLKEHSRPLPPLRQGDSVIVQNQNGRFPKKWDKSGVVVETRNNDQYVVKLAGSGRLTLRNRRFLRKHSSPFQLVQAIAPPKTPMMTAPCAPQQAHPTHTDPSSKPTTSRQSHSSKSAINPEEVQPQTPAVARCEPCTPLQPSSTPMLPSRSTSKRQQLMFGEFEEPVPSYEQECSPPVVELRVSRRNKTQREVYDAATGQFTEPCAVPDSI